MISNTKFQNLLGLFILLVFIFSSCLRPDEEIIEDIDLCMNTANIVSFNIGAKQYELIKEFTSWKSAAQCAVRKGGYLVEINDEAEQDGVFKAIHPKISEYEELAAPDGDGGSYVWIGANNFVLEKRWVWDGDGDNKGINFWFGTEDGVPVDDLYNNWGPNPDISTDHNGVAMALTPWGRGFAGNWNDLRQHNTLFYVIEYD